MRFKMLNWCFCQIFFETAVMCFITRLPCIHYAFFNIAKDWYLKGDVNKTLRSISRIDCGTSCLTNPLCIAFNYKADESLCEMISSSQLRETRVGWDLLTTNMTSDKNVGPFCEQSYPCLSNEWCRDVCQEVNHTYICLKNKNVASLSRVFQSSTYSYNTRPEMAIDGDLQTTSYTQMDPVNWLKVDLLYIYKITSIKVINRLVYPERLIGYNLMTSTKDENYQQLATLTKDWQQTFSCSNNVRFVLITKVPSNDQYLHVAEIEVWV